MSAVVETRKLDYEILDRWVKYMQKPTTKYQTKHDLQAMLKKGSATPAQVKTFAEKFQGEVVEARLAKADHDAQNKVLTDKDLDGTKPKKRTDKPSNFVSNKDFNPGALIRYKTMPDELSNFYNEVFVRELKDSDDPNAMMACCRGVVRPPASVFSPSVAGRCSQDSAPSPRLVSKPFRTISRPIARSSPSPIRSFTASEMPIPPPIFNWPFAATRKTWVPKSRATS